MSYVFYNWREIAKHKDDKRTNQQGLWSFIIVYRWCCVYIKHNIYLIFLTNFHFEDEAHLLKKIKSLEPMKVAIWLYK